jgi:hypothetical protein
MAYNIDAVLASTHARIEKKFQDNLIGKTPMYLKFAEKDGLSLIDGGKELTFPVILGNGNAGSYYGDDVLGVSRPAGLQPLTYNWRQFYSTIVIDGLEEVMNSGPEAAADLIEGRMTQGETTTANAFETMLCADGTGNGSKDWNGLANLVPDDPTTGAIGGLSRVTYAQIRSKVNATGTAAFNTAQAGRALMTNLYIQCTNGGRRPNFVVTTATVWGLYQLSLTVNERFIMEGKDKSLTSAGFLNIAFMGDAPVVFSDGVGAGRMYMLRIAKPKSDGGIFLVMNKDRNFKLGKWIEPVDQDKRVAKVLSAGQLCTDAPYLNGVLTGITG